MVPAGSCSWASRPPATDAESRRVRLRGLRQKRTTPVAGQESHLPTESGRRPEGCCKRMPESPAPRLAAHNSPGSRAGTWIRAASSLSATHIPILQHFEPSKDYDPRRRFVGKRFSGVAARWVQLQPIGGGRAFGWDARPACRPRPRECTVPAPAESCRDSRTGFPWLCKFPPSAVRVGRPAPQWYSGREVSRACGLAGTRVAPLSQPRQAVLLPLGADLPRGGPIRDRSAIIDRSRRKKFKLGHGPATWDDPTFQDLLVRGFKWAVDRLRPRRRGEPE